jgi:hypothetical protein
MPLSYQTARRLPTQPFPVRNERVQAARRKALQVQRA